MSELTDLEICKKIAEIKVEDWTVICGIVIIADEKGDLSCNGTSWSAFNPLTDNALCFQLIKEFDVDVNNEISMMYIDGGKGFCISKYGYNKAAMLAIIESHKGQ